MVQNFKKVFSLYYKLTSPHHGWAVATFTSYIAATFTLNVITPLFGASLIASIAAKQGSVFDNFYYTAAAVIFSQLCYRLGDWFLVIFENRSMVLLQQKAVEVVITQPHYFFANNHSGALIAKINRFVKSFEGMFDSIAYSFLMSFTQVVGVAIVLFSKSYVLGCILLIWVVIYFFISTRISKIRLIVDQEEASMSSEVTAVMSDIIGNAITVLLFGQRQKEIAFFKKKNIEYSEVRRKSWMYSNTQNTIQSVLTTLLELLSLFVAILLWQKNQLTASAVALVYLYMKIISNNMWEVGRTFVRFTKYVTDAYEMVDIFERKPETGTVEQYQEQDIVDGSIIVKDIVFSYSVGKNVFNGLHLKIDHGQHVGIVGPSGSGKTTLIAMLMRLYDPHNGVIEIGGTDISTVEHDFLRRNIAIVPQEVSVLHRTIFENISYGAEHATYDDVITAAKKAQIHDHIMGLPEGYDTLVGERGIKLSGGQRQRIAIARALLIDAKIIVLDEATSALDAITETYIQDILQNHLEGKTVIIIAHRLATVRHCNRIIVLQNGVIAEDGSHHELMQQNGTYAELVAHQLSY